MALADNFVLLILRILVQGIGLLYILLAAGSNQPLIVNNAVTLGLGVYWGLVDLGLSHRIINDLEARVSCLRFYVKLSWLIAGGACLLLAARQHFDGELVAHYIDSVCCVPFLLIFALYTNLSGILVSRGSVRPAARFVAVQFLLSSVLLSLSFTSAGPFVYLGLGALSAAMFSCFLLTNEKRMPPEVVGGDDPLWSRLRAVALSNQLILLLASQVDLLLAALLLSRAEAVGYLAISRGIALIYLLHVNILASFRNRIAEQLRAGFANYEKGFKAGYLKWSLVVLPLGAAAYLGSLVALSSFFPHRIAQVGLMTVITTSGLVMLYLARLILDLTAYPFFLKNHLMLINKVAVIQVGLNVVIACLSVLLLGTIGLPLGLTVATVVTITVFRSKNDLFTSRGTRSGQSA